MTDDLDPTTFTDREKAIAQEAHRRGYHAATRYWRERLHHARKQLRTLLEELDSKQ